VVTRPAVSLARYFLSLHFVFLEFFHVPAISIANDDATLLQSIVNKPILYIVLSLMLCFIMRHMFAGLKYIFLVGGFADSPMLQLELRNSFSGVAKILVPSEAGLTILKGRQ